MSKLEETNLAIDYMAKVKETGIDVDNSVFLADIAKSLAMIADKLCGTETAAGQRGRQNEQIQNTDTKK